MRRSCPPILLLIFSLVSPLANLLPGMEASHAQTKSNLPRAAKFTDDLRERIQSTANTGETARVILNLTDTANAEQLSQALAQGGAHSQKNLNALGLMVADVPLN